VPLHSTPTGDGKIGRKTSKHCITIGMHQSDHQHLEGGCLVPIDRSDVQLAKTGNAPRFGLRRDREQTTPRLTKQPSISRGEVGT